MRADLYNVIIFTGDLTKGNKGFVRWNYVNHKKVSNIYLLEADIKRNYPAWKFAHIWNRRTGLQEQTIICT